MHFDCYIVRFFNLKRGFPNWFCKSFWYICQNFAVIKGTERIIKRKKVYPKRETENWTYEGTDVRWQNALSRQCDKIEYAQTCRFGPSKYLPNNPLIFWQTFSSAIIIFFPQIINRKYKRCQWLDSNRIPLL